MSLSHFEEYFGHDYYYDDGTDRSSCTWEQPDANRKTQMPTKDLWYRQMLDVTQLQLLKPPLLIVSVDGEKGVR